MTTNQFIETEAAPGPIPLRQGDILRRVDPTQPNSIQYAVIVTADCDIEQQKSGDHLLVLPILDVSRYISSIWAPRELDLSRRRNIDTAQQLIYAIRTRSQSTASRMSVPVLEDWLINDDVDQICQSLGNVNRTERDAIKQCQYVAASCRSLASMQELNSEALAQLVEVQKLVNRSKTPIQKRPREMAVYLSRQTPLDVFPISEICGDERIGFVVYLRAPYSIPLRDIHLSYPAADMRDQYYLRAARLALTLKHHMAQRFGALFTRIGLPDEYEQDRLIAFELAAEKIFGVSA